MRLQAAGSAGVRKYCPLAPSLVGPAACHPGSGSAGRNHDEAARNTYRTVCGGREARGHRLLSPARYRHPGDMIRLIIAGLVLAAALAVTAVTHATYVDASAVAASAVAPSTLAGRVLGGVVQALFAAAAVAAFLVTLRYHRYRLLGGLHFIADLTLPYGRVLHDYKNSSQPEVQPAASSKVAAT